MSSTHKLSPTKDAGESPLVEVQGLGKSYGQHQALVDLSLSLYGGETLALLGHNGAGKTTLIKLLCGLIAPSSGKIQYHFSGTDDWRFQLGYLPENIAFNQYASGLELLSFFARLKKVNPNQCDELLDLVGLARKDRGRAVREYSKGMRQRLGLAQALLGQPQLLLLDEPTSGLDPSVRRDIYQVLDECKARGCALLICSHSLDEIESHCEKVTMLKGGRLVAQGSRQELQQAANLPIMIQVQSSAPERLGKELNGYHFDTQTSEQMIIHCQDDEKMDILQRLGRSEVVEDIRVREPGLTNLYNHFCGGE